MNSLSNPCRIISSMKRSTPLWAALAALALTSLEASAQDDDVMFFRNGDRLTGEIENLERGRLYFDTAATPAISIEWDEVAYLSSVQQIEVELTSGAIYLGRLSRADEPGQLRIETDEGTVEVPMLQAIGMTPIEATLWEQLEADLTLGYSFNKGTDIAQMNVGLDIAFRRERHGANLSIGSVMTDEVDDSTRRQNIDLSYDRYFDNRWVTRGLMAFERNDQLGIDLRSSIGGARGRFLSQTNSHILALYGGLLLNREEIDGTNQPPGTELTEDNVEAVGAVQAEWFSYDAPEFDITTTFIVYPNLSESGRVRTDFDLSLEWEIVTDLIWGISLYHDYDSDPPSAAAEKEDYGIITSIGWEF